MGKGSTLDIRITSAGVDGQTSGGRHEGASRPSARPGAPQGGHLGVDYTKQPCAWQDNHVGRFNEGLLVLAGTLSSEGCKRDMASPTYARELGSDR